MANALMAVVNPIRANCALNPKLPSNAFYSRRSLTVLRAHKKTELQQQNAAKNSWTTELKKFQKVALIAGANVAAVMPAMAIEKAALFDFNLTLPIIAAEFLILMVALDKIWFTPLGKFMDERDEMIRQKLMSVKDNSEEIRQLQEEGEAMLKAARAEVTAALNKMKKEMSAELEQKLQESRKRVEKELAVALEKLEAQRQETLRSLDQQIDDVSQQIVQKVLPFKV